MDRAGKPNTRARVLISGSGLAALEAALVLRRHAAELCRIELLSPLRDFTVRLPGSDPLGSRNALRLDLGTLAGEFGMSFRADALRSLDPKRRLAHTRRGEQLGYDAIVIASGARVREAVPGATTIWAAPDRALLDALAPSAESPGTSSIIFCAHSSEPWTLPLYELALATAGRSRQVGYGEVELSLVTPEARPAELLPRAAGDALEAALRRSGIELVRGSEPIRFEPGKLIASGGALRADRAVALPRRDGCSLDGLPLDERGFIRADGFGRVPGAEGVHAVGEAASSPLHHPALAAEQARAAAEAIAAQAGAQLSPSPAHPAISGKLLADATVPERRNGSGTIWWPPEPLAATNLRAHLGERFGLELLEPAGGLLVEVELGGAAENGHSVRAAAASSPR